MENNCIGIINIPDNLKRFVTIMRITLFLIFFGILYTHAAEGFSQEISFTLDVKSTSIKDICEELEKNSNYRFIFAGNAKSIISKKVNSNIKSENVDDILNNILSNTGLTYRILEDQIVIYQEEVNPSIREVEEIITGLAVQQQNTIRGKVTDAVTNEPLPGVTILIKGSTRGVTTDIDGTFEIRAVPTDELIFSFIGMEEQTVEVGDQTIINIVLQEQVDMLDEVTIVAFGTQKKESVIGSIETVRPSDLKIPSSNLTTALAGRVSGLISYQRSGEPGQDDANFFVRGVTSFTYAAGPLILIDGVEMSSADLSRLQPDDIRSFSVMKDATATALYGARGANGVILVTTQEGQEGDAKFNFRYETSISSPTQKIELADPVTYMRLNNEAVSTRNPLGIVPYSKEKIDKTANNENKLLYPTTNWHDILFKEHTTNHRFNFNLSGGGRVARYYIAATFNQDNGILSVPKRSNFNNNIDLKRYQLRSNVNINVTPTTQAAVRLQGTFDDYTGPVVSGAELYSRVMRSDPVLFPPFYNPTVDKEHVQHIMFGNHDRGQYINPYADMVKGYREYARSNMFAQFEVKQNLGFITEGLFLRGLYNINRLSNYEVSRRYNPFFYTLSGYNEDDESYKLVSLNPLQGTDYLSYSEGGKDIQSVTYAEAALNYDKTFGGVHTISGLLVSTIRELKRANAGTLTLSLPSRNLGTSGRFTYSFDNRYFTEFNFGYNGSERFAKNERFGFFPSAGAAWIVSNEEFWSKRMSKIVDNLKFKATYGLVGNDQIGSSSDRFFYLSEININTSNRKHTFGQDFGYTVNGVQIGRYANELITWEKSKKINLGAELGLFDKLDVFVDVYKENRENILMNRADIPSSMGLHRIPQANIGVSEGSGIDITFDYSHAFYNGLWLTGRLNFTYATAKFKEYEEVDNTETPWLSRKNQKVGQQWGYIAERLFVDDAEAENSPRQTFSEYGGGDIKYRDINRDGVINSLDMVPIGYPTHPEIIYGFGLSSGYKGFDLSFFFQGLGRESFWIDPVATAPFLDTDNNSSVDSKNQLLQAYADSRWTLEEKDIYALWPRLSDRALANNTQRSTWFMRNGSFLRLKSLEVGYTIPQKLTNKYSLTSLRLYFSGTNMLTFSNFKLWDPEMAGDGLGYPLQKVLNFGLQITF